MGIGLPSMGGVTALPSISTGVRRGSAAESDIEPRWGRTTEMRPSTAPRMAVSAAASTAVATLTRRRRSRAPVAEAGAVSRGAGRAMG
ncbi:MAG: hypothetical protein WKG00_17135, partial [Polyangiaceae bacterium]